MLVASLRDMTEGQKRQSAEHTRQVGVFGFGLIVQCREAVSDSRVKKYILVGDVL